MVPLNQYEQWTCNLDRIYTTTILENFPGNTLGIFNVIKWVFLIWINMWTIWYWSTFPFPIPDRFGDTFRTFVSLNINIADSGVTGIFFRGGKVTFPVFSRCEICFFPVEIFNFGITQTNFRGFKKWTAKKKTKQNKTKQNKTKTKSSHFHIHTSSLQLFVSHRPFQNFPSFCCLYFPGRSGKISWWKMSGGHSAPPACYATDCRRM